jgi:hypothetical protein
MLHFIVTNAATIVISALLAAAVVAVVAGGVRRLLRGQGCACDCDACERACARGNAQSRQ